MTLTGKQSRSSPEQSRELDVSRCSDCSKRLKPIVVCDIDGTLGDYHGHFQWFVSKYWNMPALVSGTTPWGNWNGIGEFEEFLGITKQQYREAKLAYRQGGMKRWMPLYPGAKEMIRELRTMGAEVWIATTRPWQRLDNIDPDTRFWLEIHGIEIDGLLYGEDKYRQLCEAVDKERVAAVIDDLPEQYEIASGFGLPVMLRDNYHNSQTGENCLTRGNLAICRHWALWKVRMWPTKER